MEDVRGRYVSPAVDQIAFNCPHCGALAKQFWFAVHADQLKTDDRPFLATAETVEKFKLTAHIEPDERQFFVHRAERMASGSPFLERRQELTDHHVHNVSIARCFNCNDITMWVYDQLFWPRRPGGPPPNLDLPQDVRRDYEEASTILDASPRGAAALLRVAIEKLCEALGGRGRNLDEAIASLVANGLDRRVQQALDAVRVIGNNAVHPGKLDLRDDRATAETLFGLVNLICEKMITEPKHLDEVYAKLPEAARQAIKKRDTPKQG
jgi:hypothetical protein